MAVGRITKLVHFTGQASRLENAAAVPTRNAIGFGYVGGGGEQLYFDASGIDGDFDQLRPGQPVAFERDPAFAIATGVRLISEEQYAAESAGGTAPTGKAESPAPAAAASTKPSASGSAATAKPATAAAPKRGKAEEVPTLVLDNARQCLVAIRYRKVADNRWRRARREPEIETYTTHVADQYATPQVTMVSDNYCVIRLFDAKAVNLRRLTDFLGDYADAQRRCDEALQATFPGATLETIDADDASHLLHEG